MHAARGRGHARVLYWFRTPPDVRVGRAALDEDAIRAIEASNPDIEFDWTRMLKERLVTAPPAERDGRERRGRETRSAAKTGRRRIPAAGAPRAAPPTDAPLESSLEPAREPLDGFGDGGETGPPSGRPEAPGPREAWPADTAPEPAALPPGLHVEERLGTEGFSRLRARYAELLARISERVTDPARLDELRTQAERLNPDTWITDAEARAGIEGFDAAYDALRARLGRRKRRSRRGGRRRRSRSPGPGSDPIRSEGQEAPGSDREDGEDGGVGDPGEEPDDPEPAA